MRSARLRLALLTAGTIGATVVTPCAVLAAPATGTISGAVSSGGTPLAAICVSAGPVGGGAPLTTTTSNAGNYRLSAPPGSYLVEFDDCNGAAGDYVTQWYDHQTDAASATPVAVTSGQTTGAVDADLTAAGSISGFVDDATSSARVTGACVKVWPQGTSNNGAAVALASAVTAADGTYQTRRLAPGAYDVRFDTDGDCPGGVDSNYFPQYLGGYPSPNSNTSVLVTAGTDASQTSAHLGAAAAISGTVTDGTNPIQGVCVFVYSAGQEPSTSRLAVVSSGADGSYLVRHLLPGADVSVQFTDDANCGGGVSGVYAPQFWDHVDLSGDASVITLVAGQTTTGIDAAMTVAGSISGTVVADDGTPLASMCVYAFPVADPTAGPSGINYTDDAGHYSIGRLPAGSYDVAFYDCFGMYPSLFTQWWDGAPDEASSSPVVVTPGADTAAVDAVMFGPTPPSPPDSLTALGGAGQVTLSWHLPADEGTAPVDSYTVYRLSGTTYLPLAKGVTGTSYVDTGLTSAHQYTYRVTATSADGEGEPAQASATTVGLPGPPTGLAAVLGNTQVRLSWSAPATDGGTPVTGYDVYRVALNVPRSLIAHNVSGTSFLDTGLVNGATYAYDVTAVNAAGSGRSSGSVQAVPTAAGPQVTVTSAPAPGTTSSDAVFAFTAGNPAQGTVSYTCSLDGAAVTACQSGVAYRGLIVGLHTWTVSVTDANGVTASAARTWVIDLTPPSIGTDRSMALKSFQLGRDVDAYFKGTDAESGVASYDFRYRTTAWNGSFGPFIAPSAWQGRTKSYVELFAAIGSTNCISARARDAAGNVSAWSGEMCTAIPLDDRAGARSRGWTSGTDRQFHFYHDTWLTSRTHGASITVKGARAHHLGLVVKRCAGCGSIAIYVGGRYWRTITTAATRTAYQEIVIARGVTSGPGTITLRVTTAGKPVTIDGIGISRV